MEFIVKRTTDLSKEEIDMFVELFSEVFGKIRTDREVINEYTHTPFGYSFHGLIYDDGKIVGAHSLIPFHYYFGNEKLLFAVTADTMTDKSHRELYNIMQLVRTCETAAKEAGITMVFGFPNENSYPVFKKGLKYKDVGDLNTYILPYKIGGVKASMKLFNVFSMFSSHFLIAISRLFRGSLSKHDFLVQKDTLEFLNNRYLWFDQDYKVVKAGEDYFSYKILVHEGVKSAFLIDCTDTSKRAFQQAISYIFKHHRHEFDVLLYVGILPFCPFNMLRIPHKYEPKHFHFHAKNLDKSRVDDRVFDLINWNVNLSNYDLL